MVSRFVFSAPAFLRDSIANCSRTTVTIRWPTPASRSFSSVAEDNKAKDTSSPAVKLKIDCSVGIPVEQSIKYLQSKAYATTYGSDPVWLHYRRNFKGQFAPPETRKTCIRAGKISTGNPCPVCRDEYLVLHPQNVQLLTQFISPHNGEILPTKKTGLCRLRQRELMVAVMKAHDLGLISFDLPDRDYDYDEYRPTVSSISARE